MPAGVVVVVAVVAVVAIAMVAVLGIGARALALLELPSATGRFPVGTLEDRMADGVPVAFWYPARSTSAMRVAPYSPGRADLSLRKRLVLSFVRTGSYLDAPVAAGQHAVVLYLPGWGEGRTDNTALCEDVASHGFVVVAIDDLHPEPPMDFSTAAAYRGTLRWADTKVELAAHRASRLLTELANARPTQPAYALTRAMDFGRVAAVGFSFGGASAAEAAIHDARIRAAVDLDGWTFGDASRSGVAKPFLIIASGAPTVDPPVGGAPQAVELDGYAGKFDRFNIGQIMAGLRRYGGYYVNVNGADHDSFSDAGLLSFGLRPTPGTIDGRRTQRIIVAYIDAFLGATLEGHAAPLLTKRAGNPAVLAPSPVDRAAQIAIWNGPAAAGVTSR